MEEKGLSVADALALQKAGGNNNDGFLGGGQGAWWIIILILFFGMAMNGGWGNNGNNGGNGTNTVVVPMGGQNFSNPYGYSACCSPATAQGLTDAFNFNSISNGISATREAVTSGFYQNNLATTNLGTAIQSDFGQVALQNCQGFNSVNQTIANGVNSINSNLSNGFSNSNSNLNNGINSIQASLCNGFNNIQTAIANNNNNMQNCCCETREAIMQSNFNNQAGFNAVVNALATNACDIERGQDDIRYIMAQNQSSTLSAIDHVGDRLIDYMNQSKMDELRTELQNAKFQISQAAQTDAIINQLQPIAKPSYLVNSPYQSLTYNAVNGCGCGNF